MNNVVDSLSLPDKVNLMMRLKHLTYDEIIPTVNKLLPDDVRPVAQRSELSRAINRGMVNRGNRGKKNNSIIRAVATILEFEVEVE